MIYSVVKKGDPLLNTRCREIVDVSQAQELITDLWDTLISIQKIYNFTRGSGIAAPQIDKLWRASVVQFNGQRYTLINPRIVAHSDRQLPIREGCLSFFKYRGKALRYTDVTIQALNEHGKPFNLSSDGDTNFASLLQHELDHLDGILYESVLAPGEQLVRHPEMPNIP